MKSFERVLELLFDRGEGYFPLEELARAAEMTARQLAKNLGLLEQQGMAMERSPFGVRLARPVRLHAFLLERGLGTQRVGRHILCFDEVNSTNDVAFDSARQRGADGLVVLADAQREGRGRQGRRWLSPAGANILMSVVLLDEEERLAHEALTIASGLAAAQGIEDAAGVSCGLKWPNDVLLEGGKLVGILVEIQKVARRRCVVIGAGVNVNAAPPAERIGQPSANLAGHVGHAVDRYEVIRAILRRLDEWVEEIGRGECERLHREWMARCVMMNQRVTAMSGGRTVVGRVVDVSPLAGLVLSCDDGRQVYLQAANSTIVK